MSITIQYIIIGAIFLLTAIWIWRKVKCRNTKKNSGCCGCTLSESCRKKKLS